MDLNLSLAYSQQNDNKAVILTDDTLNYNYQAIDTIGDGVLAVENTVYQIVSQGTVAFTTYGATSNAPGTRFVWTGAGVALGAGDELREVTPRVDEITGATLDTIFTGTSEVPTPKPQIDLFAEFGPFAGQTDMVYKITSELWGDGVDELIPDGLYELDYQVTYLPVGSSNPKTDSLLVTILVYGQVKVAVYDKFRQIPAWCECKNQDNLHKILEADLCGAYLTGIEHSAYLAKTEELIHMLIVLEDMVKNGSKLYY